MIRAADNPGERMSLTLAEASFAFGRKNLGDGLPGRSFDHVVHVHERPAQPGREQAADGRLARAAGADEVNARREVSHRLRVTGPAKGPCAAWWPSAPRAP